MLPGRPVVNLGRTHALSHLFFFTHFSSVCFIPFPQKLYISTSQFRFLLVGNLGSIGARNGGITNRMHAGTSWEFRSAFRHRVDRLRTIRNMVMRSMKHLQSRHADSLIKTDTPITIERLLQPPIQLPIIAPVPRVHRDRPPSPSRR